MLKKVEKYKHEIFDFRNRKCGKDLPSQVNKYL